MGKSGARRGAEIAGKRHQQDSAVNLRYKVDVTGQIIWRCGDCSGGEGRKCSRYGKKISFPVSGPIDTWCRLRNAEPLEE